MYGVTKENLFLTIQKKDTKKMNVSIKYDGPLKAPIKKGDEIGELIVKKNDENTQSYSLYANDDVKKVNFFKSLFLSFNYMIWGDV